MSNPPPEFEITKTGPAESASTWDATRASAETETTPAARGSTPDEGGLPRSMGPYEIVRELGRGGMGVVYEVRRSDLGTRHALKVLLAGLDASAEAMERFQREARAAATLRHPGIVPVVDFSQADGKPYLVMELVEGATLDRVLEDPPRHGLKTGPVPSSLEGREAVQIVRDAALAIAYAHASGFVHRDLKPHNIIRERDGRVRVTDFGLAKPLQGGAVGLTATGSVIGTPAYMAPEQAAGRVQETGPAADVYALGAVLYHLLVGRPPYDGTGALEVLQRVVQEEPKPVRALAPTIERDLERIVLRAMGRVPAVRYASAAEFAEDLSNFLRGETVQAGGWVASGLRRLAGALMFGSMCGCVVLVSFAGLAGLPKDGLASHGMGIFILAGLSGIAAFAAFLRGGPAVRGLIAYGSVWGYGAMVFAGLLGVVLSVLLEFKITDRGLWMVFGWAALIGALVGARRGYRRGPLAPHLPLPSSKQVLGQALLGASLGFLSGFLVFLLGMLLLVHRAEVTGKAPPRALRLAIEYSILVLPVLGSATLVLRAIRARRQP